MVVQLARFCLAWSALASSASAIASAVDVEVRFQNEFPEKRAEWKRIEPTLILSDVSDMTIRRKGAVVDRIRQTRKEREGSYVRCVEFLNDSGSDRPRESFAYVRNPSYSFQLLKTKGEWVLRSVNVDAPTRQQSIEAIPVIGLRKSLFPDYTTPETKKRVHIEFKFSDDFDQLARTRNFRLMSVTSIPGTAAVRVEYQNTFYDDASQQDYPSKGWVIYDTARFWAPIDFSFTFGDAKKSVTRSRRDVLFPHEKYPLVAQSLVTESVQTLEAIEETRHQTTSHEIRLGEDVHEIEFRLSAFGLPEPVGVTPPPSRTPRYLWFLAAAVGFAALAVAFRWLTRRRNPPAAPEGTA